MKRLFPLILLIGLSVEGMAQFNFSIGKSMYPLHAPDFDSFFSSYNKALEADIQKPFESEFKTAQGWNWKLGYLLQNHDNDVRLYFNSTTGFTYMKTTNEATFINNEKRRAVLRFSDWNTDVALGVGSDFFHLAAVGSVLLHQEKIYNSFIFSDGSESFGSDHYLNGIFHGSRICASYGAEVGAGLKYMQLVFKASKVYKPFEKEGSPYLEYYSDLQLFKDMNVANNNWPTSYMPRDYEYFLNDQLNSESNNNFVFLTDRGWQFSLNLMFILDFTD